MVVVSGTVKAFVRRNRFTVRSPVNPLYKYNPIPKKPFQNFKQRNERMISFIVIVDDCGMLEIEVEVKLIKKFMEEVDQHFEQRRSTFEGVEAHDIDVREIVEKQSMTSFSKPQIL